MHKLLATIVASTFVLGSAVSFAADTAKKEDLTQDQRLEMRSRAERLTQERAQGSTQVKTDAGQAQKPAKPVKKTKKESRHGATKQPKA